MSAILDRIDGLQAATENHGWWTAIVFCLLALLCLVSFAALRPALFLGEVADSEPARESTAAAERIAELPPAQLIERAPSVSAVDATETESMAEAIDQAMSVPVSQPVDTSVPTPAVEPAVEPVVEPAVEPVEEPATSAPVSATVGATAIASIIERDESFVERPDEPPATAADSASAADESVVEQERQSELAVLKGFSAGVSFVAGSSEFSAGAIAALDKMFDPLFIHQDVDVTVHVVSADGGPTASSDALSRRRANRVVDYFVERGLDRTRFKIAVDSAWQVERLPDNRQIVAVLASRDGS